jgi:hypothetical protein
MYGPVPKQVVSNQNTLDCNALQFNKYLLSLEDGRLVQSFEGKVTYDCTPAHFTCQLNICVSFCNSLFSGLRGPAGASIIIEGISYPITISRNTGPDGCTGPIFVPTGGVFRLTASWEGQTAQTTWRLSCGDDKSYAFWITQPCFTGCAGPLPDVTVLCWTSTQVTDSTGCIEVGFLGASYQVPNPGPPPVTGPFRASHGRFETLTGTMGGDLFTLPCGPHDTGPWPPYEDTIRGNWLVPDKDHVCWCACGPPLLNCNLPVGKVLLLTDSVLGEVTLTYREDGPPWGGERPGFKEWYGEIAGLGTDCGCGGGGGQVYYTLSLVDGSAPIAGPPPVSGTCNCTLFVSYSNDGRMAWSPPPGDGLWRGACCFYSFSCLSQYGCGRCSLIPGDVGCHACPGGDGLRPPYGFVLGIKPVPVLVSCPIGFSAMWQKGPGTCLHCPIYDFEHPPNLLGIFPCGPCDAWDNQSATFIITEP